MGTQVSLLPSIEQTERNLKARERRNKDHGPGKTDRPPVLFNYFLKGEVAGKVMNLTMIQLG